MLEKVEEGEPVELLVLRPREVGPLFFVFILPITLKGDRSTTREETGTTSTPAWESRVILLGSIGIGGGIPVLWEAVGVTIGTLRTSAEAWEPRFEGSGEF